MGRRSLPRPHPVGDGDRMTRPVAQHDWIAAGLGFGSPVPGLDASHLPPSLERFQHVLETHASMEEDSLAEYRALAAQSRDPVVKTLMELILDDEQRHHALLRRMATRLADDIHWTHSPEALEVDRGPIASGPAIEATRRFVREEREGARHLRAMRDDAALIHDGFFALLLEVMARDSEKHERILRFILARLEEPARR